MELNFKFVPRAARYTFGINWRTGLGAIAPAMASLGLIFSAIANKQWPDTRDVVVIWVALSSAWVAIFAKDKNVTGGQISNVTGEKAAAPVSLVDMTPTKQA